MGLSVAKPENGRGCFLAKCSGLYRKPCNCWRHQYSCRRRFDYAVRALAKLLSSRFCPYAVSVPLCHAFIGACHVWLSRLIVHRPLSRPNGILTLFLDRLLSRTLFTSQGVQNEYVEAETSNDILAGKTVCHIFT